jgi:hypothetical protein
MPALVSFSKEKIVELLTEKLKLADNRIAELEAELNLLYRKIDHGCANFNCSLCDKLAKPRPKPRGCSCGDPDCPGLTEIQR